MQACAPRRPSGAPSRFPFRDTTIRDQRAVSFGFGRSRTALCCALLALFTQTSAAAQRGPGAARRRPAPPQASLPAGLPPEVAAAGPAVLLHEDAEGRADRRLLSLAGSAGGGFAALWSDLRHGTPVVYVRRFGRGGEALGDERPVRESYSAVMELVPSLALGPEGQAAIAYQLERDPVGPRAFRVRRLDPDGSFCIYTEVAVDLVIDVQGSFSASNPLGFTLMNVANRVLDTRRP